MKKGQVAMEWLFSAAFLLFSILLLSHLLPKSAPSQSFSGAADSIQLAKSSAIAHSASFLYSSQPLPGQYMANNNCLSTSYGARCQIMAMRMHIDRGEIKYAGENNEPL